MMRRGSMVRAGGSAIMMILDVDVDDVAKCVWIDGEGHLNVRHHEVASLSPLEMSQGAKSLWPEITQLDFLALEEEGRLIAMERTLAKRKTRRARKSLKIKRRAAA